LKKKKRKKTVIFDDELKPLGSDLEEIRKAVELQKLKPLDHTDPNQPYGSLPVEYQKKLNEKMNELSHVIIEIANYLSFDLAKKHGTEPKVFNTIFHINSVLLQVVKQLISATEDALFIGVQKLVRKRKGDAYAS